MILTKQEKVDAIVRYYTSSNPNLRTILEPIDFGKRWKILNEVGNNISYYNKFGQDSNLLEGWIRYRYEPKIINDFLNLSQDEIKLFTFLRRYGKTSAKGFNNIKSKPKEYIKHLLDYPEAAHHIDYYNTRRAEILPPDYLDIATKKPCRTHETDSFIELELTIGGKSRTSLSNEAGDIIMQGGSLNGKSLDPLGIRYDLSQKISQQQDIMRFYTNWLGEYIPNQESKGFLGSIDKHFRKITNPIVGKPALDVVVIDYKYFDEISIAIGQSPNYLRQQIDLFIITNFSQYNNSNFLIKLNY